uniref:Uncharacterized protein n=1 Tax=Hyaloperonospora arabidopsidis (strain Emoy2) TaxID=559515 RepID=M4B155_HYAAE
MRWSPRCNLLTMKPVRKDSVLRLRVYTPPTSFRGVVGVDRLQRLCRTPSLLA